MSHTSPCRAIITDLKIEGTLPAGYPYATNAYWCFGATVALLTLGAYAILLVAQNPVACCSALTIAYFGTSILAISFGHQALHGALSPRRQVNRVVGELTFLLLGVDGELWRRRHLTEHHPAPNTRGYDADIDSPTLFRLSPLTEHRPYHRFQHLYGALVYSAGVLLTVTISDVVQLCRTLQRLPARAGHGTIGRFTARKIAFFGIWFAAPLLFNQSLSGVALALALAAATVPTAWLFLPIAAAHLNVHVMFFEDHERPSFTDHQQLTTVDFCRQSLIVTWIYGGLNCHLAHHLWPKVACCHYRILSTTLAERVGNFQELVPSLTLGQLFRSHFRLLRELGQNATVEGVANHVAQSTNRTITILSGKS